MMFYFGCYCVYSIYLTKGSALFFETVMVIKVGEEYKLITYFAV